MISRLRQRILNADPLVIDTMTAVGLALFAWALLGMSVSAIGRARRPATAATPPPVN